MAKSPIQVILQFDRTHEYLQQLPAEIALALDRAAALIEGQAKSNAPVRTGALRASGYRISPVYDDYAVNMSIAMGLNPYMLPDAAGNVGPDEAIVGFSADYAGYVHDGTYRTAGNPFLMMAVDQYADTVRDYIAEGVNRASDRLSGVEVVDSTTASESMESGAAEALGSG